MAKGYYRPSNHHHFGGGAAVCTCKGGPSMCRSKEKLYDINKSIFSF